MPEHYHENSVATAEFSWWRTALIRKLGKIEAASEPARRKDPHGFASNANVKLLRAVNRAMSEVIPQEPSRAEYRQGNTLGPRFRHWRRVRIGRRFRLFFRHDAKARVIVHAWMNDERTLRSSGSRTDPYTVFAKMLARGNPPDDWASLIAASRQGPQPEEQGRPGKSRATEVLPHATD